MLIEGTSDENVKAFELFAGKDQLTGPFESLGKFQTQNMKFFQSPYQAFEFPPVNAKYLKIKLLSTYGSYVYPTVYEFQLWGRSEEQ